ncbi:MAG: hypothetical protein FIA92_14290 [Chloroflexi bacterium]|nr:hypothetical protein [Chloroflexota bacterium]
MFQPVMGFGTDWPGSSVWADDVAVQSPENRMCRTLAALAMASAMLIAACSSGSPTNPPTNAPVSPTPGAPSTPPAGSPSAGVVVTIDVTGETYKILLTDPADIAVARDLLAGREAPSIPNGKVVRGEPGVNEGYSWHIDPNDIEWADMTIELCDGKPSDVEANTISGDRFCPWSAKVVAVEDDAN